MAARPIWRGQIRLALVSIPVEIFSATKSGAPAREARALSNGLFTGAILDVARNRAADDDPKDACLNAGELGKHISTLMARSGDQVPVVPAPEFARVQILQFVEPR